MHMYVFVCVQTRKHARIHTQKQQQKHRGAERMKEWLYIYNLFYEGSK